METDITNILCAAFLLLCALASAFAIPYYRAKVSPEKRKDIADRVDIAVKAAEQIYKGPGHGEQKKQYVLDLLAKKGVKIDLDRLNAMIESAVFELNEEMKKNE